jgi:uncharacterized protein YgbK (DUF1537 family)
MSDAAICKSETFVALPPVWFEDLPPRIRTRVAARPAHKLVVLDDDPTGTQTVHDVPVLTTWDVETLRAEFAEPGACFYILTNSRSLTADAAETLSRDLASSLRVAAGDATFTVISRSDSTLRGHFPLETDVLTDVLGPFDATLLMPYFEAGGRYTIGDVHYVAEGDRLVPAAETPFAKDAVFGYKQSNLREWVEEKTQGRVRAADVASVSLEMIRRGGPDEICRHLQSLPRGAVGIVNAAAPADLEVVALALLKAEHRGRRYLVRGAAQMVAARLGLEPRPLLTATDLGVAGKGGGLVVVGSYVPKTSEQLAHLLAETVIDRIELAVPDLLDPAQRGACLANALDRLHASLRAGRDIVVFTSRDLVTGADAAQSLAIGRSISAALVELVQRLRVHPRYLVAKGGITSSDLATQGLGLKRGLVAGQILPGIPVWRLGPETRFPDLPYIVFPGNVGGPTALTDTVNKLRTINTAQQEAIYP